MRDVIDSSICPVNGPYSHCVPRRAGFVPEVVQMPFKAVPHRTTVEQMGRDWRAVQYCRFEN